MNVGATAGVAEPLANDAIHSPARSTTPPPVSGATSISSSAATSVQGVRGLPPESIQRTMTRLGGRPNTSPQHPVLTATNVLSRSSLTPTTTSLMLAGQPVAPMSTTLVAAPEAAKRHTFTVECPVRPFGHLQKSVATTTLPPVRAGNIHVATEFVIGVMTRC